MKLLIPFLIATFFFKNLHCQNLKIIRDAETENLLTDLSKILTKDTHLEGENLKFYLDNKNYINAFVTPEKHFFFTKELLLKSEMIDDIAGVLSHEIGHLVGGHFINREKMTKKSAMMSILSSILAVGAIAGGAPAAGSALLMGGQHLTSARALAFSRSQEHLADQTAIRLMNNNGFSLKGLINIFEKLQNNERLKKINPYFLTHPLSSERIKNIKLNIRKSQKLRDFSSFNERFSLIKAKFNGYFLSEDQITSIYPENNIQKYYALVFNNYRRGKVRKSIEQIRKCIEYNNGNPYFYEILGQIYFEQGDFDNAIKSFIEAIRINPKEKSFELFLAKSLYHSKTNLNYKKSINLLDKYIKNDDFPVDAWHYLGLNYGKLKKLDLSSYAFAEKYLLVNQLDNATIHINRAKQLSNNIVLLNKLSDLEYQINKRKGK